MKVDIWIPIYVNDYIADTMDLTTEEHGIYFILILHYWKKGCLPLSMKRLHTITKTNNTESLEGILSEYFTKREDGYHNKRLEEELKKAKSRRGSASENGKRGGRPKKIGNPDKTCRLNEGSENDNPEHNPQESSSSSSSSSNTPTKEDKEFTLSERISIHIEQWNSFSNLPVCKYNSINLPNSGEIASKLSIFDHQEVTSAIESLGKFYEKIEPKYQPTSFHRFIINSLDGWVPSAKPELKYESSKRKTTDEEVDKVAKEMFGK